MCGARFTGDHAVVDRALTNRNARPTVLAVSGAVISLLILLLVMAVTLLVGVLDARQTYRDLMSSGATPW